MKKILVMLVALIGFGFCTNAQSYKHFYKSDGAKISLASTGEVLYYPAKSDKVYEGAWDNTTNGSYRITIIVVLDRGIKEKWTANLSGFDVKKWERTTSGRASMYVEGGPGGTFTLNDK